MPKFKILFLGYGKKKTKIINFLKKKNYKITLNFNRNISLIKALKYDLIISFGYRKIIKKKIIKNLSNPIINLHMSYLPYNRGANPNYWSFINNTPKGVTIHEVNHVLDGGKIIFQKKVKFNLNKKLSFDEAYKILFKELEFLFLENYKKIIYRNYKPKKQIKIYKLNYSKELPKNFDWSQNINDYLKKLNIFNF